MFPDRLALIWAAAGVGLGLIAGSFIAALSWRWPQGRAITGRSACDHCGARLSWTELVPLLSFLAQRGRCRHCGAAIASRHLVIELAAAAVGGLLCGAAPGLPGLAAALAGWWLLALLITDVEHHWLPDALTLPLIPAGLALGMLIGHAPLAERALAALLGFAALAALRLFYRWRTGREGMGGGDPKLLAGIGALLGPLALPFLITGAALLGLVLALLDRARGRQVEATTALPFGALLAGMALIWLVVGPGWWEMLR